MIHAHYKDYDTIWHEYCKVFIHIQRPSDYARAASIMSTLFENN